MAKKRKNQVSKHIIIPFTIIFLLLINFRQIKVQLYSFAYMLSNDKNILSEIIKSIYETNLYYMKKDYYKILFSQDVNELNYIIVKITPENENSQFFHDMLLLDYIFSYVMTDDYEEFKTVFYSHYYLFEDRTTISDYLLVISSKLDEKHARIDSILLATFEIFKHIENTNITELRKNLYIQLALYMINGDDAKYLETLNMLRNLGISN